jgi:hypothetical protein
MHSKLGRPDGIGHNLLKRLRKPSLKPLSAPMAILNHCVRVHG